MAPCDPEVGSSVAFVNPVMPQLYHRLTLNRPGENRHERVQGDASYTGQLRAFVEHVRGGDVMSNDAWDGAANMRVIDAIYRAADLPLRGGDGKLSR